MGPFLEAAAKNAFSAAAAQPQEAQAHGQHFDVLERHRGAPEAGYGRAGVLWLSAGVKLPASTSS